jgi:hypothetical protein
MVWCERLNNLPTKQEFKKNSQNKTIINTFFYIPYLSSKFCGTLYKKQTDLTGIPDPNEARLV